MSENYDSLLCAEKHKRIEERLNIQDTRLNNHSERIDKLEQRGAKVDAKMDNLCDQVKNLVTTLKWFMGMLLGSFVGFFFYAVQKGLFK